MSTGKETSLWYLLIPVALVLMALGAFLVFPLIQQETGEAQQCNALPVNLTNPLFALTQALNDLHEEAVIPSVEAALDALLGANWVFDPADEYRLEYWIELRTGSSSNTAGFAVICIGPDLEMVWTYDGIQTP